MAIVSRLGVVLGLDSAQFNQGLGLAESKLGNFAKSTIGSKLGVAALGTALVGAAVNAVQYADSINDTAKANDIAVGTVLKLSEALSISGGNSENVGKLFSSFTAKVDEAANGSDKGREAFEKLNISVSDLRRLDETALFEKTLKGLNDIKDPITRNALAMDLLGKAAKNVDWNSVADSYYSNSGKFDDAEKAFKDIGDAIDKMDMMTKRASASLATVLAPALSSSVTFLDKAINGWNNLTKAIDKATLAKDGGKWSPTPKIGDKGSNFGAFNLPAEYQAGGVRGQDLSDKDQAKKDKAADKAKSDAKKLADEIQKQKQLLEDQVIAYDAQRYAAGRVLTEVEKINIELEQGKKYQYTSAEEKEKLLNAARLVDAAKYSAEFEAKRLEMAKQASDLIYNSQVATERLDVERQMVGLSDTQMQLALEYFDLQKKILDMQKQGYDEKYISTFANAEMMRIKAQELNERAQNTFQAGWDKAYNNFVERAQDSAAIGANVFNNMTNSMSSALDRFVETGKLSFGSLVESMIKDLLKLMMQSQVSGFFSSMFGGGFSSSSTNFANGGGIEGFVKGIFGYADGGSPPVGVPSMVGERGPELFIPKTAGTIIPNNQLSNVMGKQPQNVYNGPYIANMQTIDSKSFQERIYESSSAVWAANQYANKSLAVNGGKA